MIRKSVWALALLGVGLLLAGCGSGNPSASDAMAPETAVGETKQDPTTISGPQIIRTAYVDIRVVDVAEATAKLIAATAASSGAIDSQSVNFDGTSTYANIVVRVPSATLDAFVADLSQLGTVISVSINAQDVTTQVVDLDARI